MSLIMPVSACRFGRAPCSGFLHWRKIPFAVFSAVLLESSLLSFIGVVEACMSTTSLSNAIVPSTATCTPSRCSGTLNSAGNTGGKGTVNLLSLVNPADVHSTDPGDFLKVCSCPGQAYDDISFQAYGAKDDPFEIICQDQTKFCACSVTGECFTLVDPNGNLHDFEFHTKCFNANTCNGYLYLDCSEHDPTTLVVSTTNPSNTFSCADQKNFGYLSPIQLLSWSCNGCVNPTCIECNGPTV